MRKLIRYSICGIALTCMILVQLAVADTQTSLRSAAMPSSAQLQKGWIAIFDGESTFGWTVVKGHAEVKDNILHVGAKEATQLQSKSTFPPGDIRLVTVSEIKDFESIIQLKETKPIMINVTPETIGRFRQIWYRPAESKPIFNGKDLSGWKRFNGEAKREKSTFDVSPRGEIQLKNGPGDLQTEATYADFLLRVECKTQGKALNSGIFFRCLPGQYQQGYEAQIHNGFKNNDRTQPTDFGTGAIYRRLPTRKVVADDQEWFAMTILAFGNNIATWVNGYPTVNWTDDRKPANNARTGAYTKAGAISLQGHDPTTDLLFRNLHISMYPETK